MSSLGRPKPPAGVLKLVTQGRLAALGIGCDLFCSSWTSDMLEAVAPWCICVKEKDFVTTSASQPFNCLNYSMGTGIWASSLFLRAEAVGSWTIWFKSKHAIHHFIWWKLCSKWTERNMKDILEEKVFRKLPFLGIIWVKELFYCHRLV